MSSSLTETPKSYSYSSTEPALYFIEDVMERAMIPFFLLGETAKHVIENLDCEVNVPIYIGVKKNDLTRYSLSTLKMFLPADTEYTDKSISFTWKDTPVKIKIVHRNYRFLKNLDFVYYRITQYRIPNPFPEYWRVRNVVQ